MPQQMARPPGGNGPLHHRPPGWHPIEWYYRFRDWVHSSQDGRPIPDDEQLPQLRGSNAARDDPPFVGPEVSAWPSMQQPPMSPPSNPVQQMDMRQPPMLTEGPQVPQYMPDTLREGPAPVSDPGVSSLLGFSDPKEGSSGGIINDYTKHGVRRIV